MAAVAADIFIRSLPSATLITLNTFNVCLNMDVTKSLLPDELNALLWLFADWNTGAFLINKTRGHLPRSPGIGEGGDW